MWSLLRVPEKMSFIESEHLLEAYYFIKKNDWTFEERKIEVKLGLIYSAAKTLDPLVTKKHALV